jgi:hypothetical protein
VRPNRYVILILESAIRSASAFAFASQLLTLAMNLGPLNLAIRGHLDLGRRFWMNLGPWNATLAFVCLIPSLALLISRHDPRFGETAKNTRWCAGLNLTTIALLFFVPAIAVSR